jgi:hypothetical protein
VSDEHKRIPPAVLAGIEADTNVVVALCERLGFGFVIQQAAREWLRRDPRGAIVTGPCAFFTVPCGCEVLGDCDRCHGAGWQFKSGKGA